MHVGHHNVVGGVHGEGSECGWIEGLELLVIIMTVKLAIAQAIGGGEGAVAGGMWRGILLVWIVVACCCVLLRVVACCCVVCLPVRGGWVSHNIKRSVGRICGDTGFWWGLEKEGELVRW